MRGILPVDEAIRHPDIRALTKCLTNRSSQPLADLSCSSIVREDTERQGAAASKPPFTIVGALESAAP
jgi:hypothetical protein